MRSLLHPPGMRHPAEVAALIRTRWTSTRRSRRRRRTDEAGTPLSAEGPVSTSPGGATLLTATAPTASMSSRRTCCSWDGQVQDGYDLSLDDVEKGHFSMKSASNDPASHCRPDRAWTTPPSFDAQGARRSCPGSHRGTARVAAVFPGESGAVDTSHILTAGARDGARNGPSRVATGRDRRGPRWLGGGMSAADWRNCPGSSAMPWLPALIELPGRRRGGGRPARHRSETARG